MTWAIVDRHGAVLLTKATRAAAAKWAMAHNRLLDEQRSHHIHEVHVEWKEA